jgi:hypothetical protein
MQSSESFLQRKKSSSISGKSGNLTPQKKVISKTVSPPVLIKSEVRPPHPLQQQQKQLLVTKSSNNNQLVKAELVNPLSPAAAKPLVLSNVVAKKSLPTFHIKTELAEEGQTIKREGK